MKVLKALLTYVICFVISFAVIYLAVFLGGWKLFESGDPILIELGAALIVAFFVLVGYEVVTAQNRQITALEKRVAELESRHASPKE